MPIRNSDSLESLASEGGIVWIPGAGARWRSGGGGARRGATGGGGGPSRRDAVRMIAGNLKSLTPFPQFHT